VRLDSARSKLSAEECEHLVLGIARQDLEIELDRYVTDHRRNVIAAIENWWDKYYVNLQELEVARNIAAKKLAEFEQDMGYVS
jgi:hypothetical protein